jgi:hypothetical protein
MLALGLGNKAIAARLGISEHTALVSPFFDFYQAGCFVADSGGGNGG